MSEFTLAQLLSEKKANINWHFEEIDIRIGITISEVNFKMVFHKFAFSKMDGTACEYRNEMNDGKDWPSLPLSLSFSRCEYKDENWVRQREKPVFEN